MGGLLSALALSAAWACSEPARPVATSLLVVTVDTLRPDYLGFNGYDRPTTPTLDALLAESWYFERAYAPVPRTTPALASLWTGAYPHTTGVRSLTQPLAPGVHTLAQVLRARGYQTRAVVTNHILSAERRLQRGFEIYKHATAIIPASQTTTLATELIDELDPLKPAFVWVHYLDPHIPYAPPDEIAQSFDPGYEGPHARDFRLQPSAEAAARGAPTGPRSPHRGRATHRNPLPEGVNRHIRRLYAGEIRRFDDALAPVLAAMRARYGDRVLVVFTADHGESLGEHDFYWDHGDYVYDAASRVPLAFHLPPDHAWAGPGRCAAVVSLVDVVPTLLDVLEIDPPESVRSQLEGRSLAGCFEAGELEARPAFVESGRSFFPGLVRRRVRFDVAGRFRAVVDGRWKLIWTPFLPDPEAFELYDLETDPGESIDLYREGHPEAVRLRALLEAWMRGRDEGDEGPRTLSPPDEAALRSLGYIE